MRSNSGDKNLFFIVKILLLLPLLLGLMSPVIAHLSNEALMGDQNSDESADESKMDCQTDISIHQYCDDEEE